VRQTRRKRQGDKEKKDRETRGQEDSEERKVDEKVNR